MKRHRFLHLIVGLSVSAGWSGCKRSPPPKNFNQVTIDPDAYGHRAVGDLDGDGAADLAVVDFAGGGQVVWYQFPTWAKFDVATVSNYRDYNAYRADDMRLADVDGDGDQDVVGRLGKPDDDGEGLVVWWENPAPGTEVTLRRDWRRHNIGITDYVKDLAVADFNNDGKLDVAAREHTETHIFLQTRSSDHWSGTKIEHHAHEGMAVGDLDVDGDTDLILNGFWLENPHPQTSGTWVEHNIDKKWYTQAGHGWKDNNSNVAVGDVDGDGKLDVLLSQSELPGFPVSYYTSKDPTSIPWQEHRIVDVYDYCQTLHAADFDGDGDVDVLAAEFPRYDAPYPVVIYWNKGNGASFEAQKLTDEGMYHGTVGDIGSDGDLDISGTRSFNREPIQVWENQLSDQRRAARLKSWTYIEVDRARSRRFFGLGVGDVNGDGREDIASGHYVYLNPGGTMEGAWKRRDLPEKHDALLVVDVDGDEALDVIAMTGDGGVLWLEAQGDAAVSWSSRQVAKLSKADHGISSQGYALVSVFGGSKPEIILNAEGLYSLQVPDNPNADQWPVTRIASDSSQGVGYGDINQDGLMDVVACNGNPSVHVAWYRNPGNQSEEWRRYQLGRTEGWCDRIEAADLNGDGQLDVVVSEETQSREPGSARVFWFGRVVDPKQPWTRHLIVAQYTTNSMDAADIDGDGDVDLLTGEHRGSKKLSIWENDGKAGFTEHVVATGKENHLGARLHDLDGDGALDIVGIAWDEFQYLHLWRNNPLSAGWPAASKMVDGTP